MYVPDWAEPQVVTMKWGRTGQAKKNFKQGKWILNVKKIVYLYSVSELQEMNFFILSTGILLSIFYLATKGTGTGIMSNKKCSKVMMSSLQFYVFLNL